MPTPREGESRSDFMARCVPEVLDHGTAESTDQAVAICSSLWSRRDVPAPPYRVRPWPREKAPRDLSPAIRRLAARMEPRVRRSFLAAASGAATAVDLRALADAVRSGRLHQVEAAAMLDLFSAGMRERMLPLIGRTFSAGVAVGAEAIGAEITFGLDVRRPESIAWVRQHGADLVTGITDSTRQAIRELLVASQQFGRSPDALAQQIRTLIGLDPRRAAAAQAFLGRLVEIPGVTSDAVQRRYERYAAALLRARALLIARTETITAASEGQEQLWARAVSEGFIDPSKVVRVWHTADDDRVDPICALLDEAEAPIGVPFQPGGYMRPPAHPACRCGLTLRYR